MMSWNSEFAVRRDSDEGIVAMSYLHFANFHLRDILNSQLGWTRLVGSVERRGKAAADVWHINKYKRKSKQAANRRSCCAADARRMKAGIITVLIYSE